MDRITCLLVVTLTLAVLIAAGSAASVHAATPCGRMNGPTVHWQRQTHSHYIVTAFHGTTCSFARIWVAKIVNESTPNGSLAMPKGPAGWSCLARSAGRIAFNGACRNSLKSFSWGAA